MKDNPLDLRYSIYNHRNRWYIGTWPENRTIIFSLGLPRNREQNSWTYVTSMKRFRHFFPPTTNPARTNIVFNNLAIQSSRDSSSVFARRTNTDFIIRDISPRTFLLTCDIVKIRRKELGKACRQMKRYTSLLMSRIWNLPWQCNNKNNTQT